MKNAYEELVDHYDKVNDLAHVYSIAAWDEASMMPEGGGESRGRALATLGVTIHDMIADKKVGDWIDTCSNLNLNDWQSANVREMRREYEKATCLPSDFVRRQSIAQSTCEQAWRFHRAENNWDAMAPLLTEVVKHAREEAARRAEQTGLSLYDAMLDGYEPGMRSEKLDSLFAGLKDFLPGFVDEVIERQNTNPLEPMGNNFSIEKQRELGIEVMGVLGFDFNHGRLDVSHHPFCGGVQEDVRITTRYTTDNFVESLMAVIHETGHAMYEQGRPAEFAGQPVSAARSSGVHESQSLLMEMQACRSAEFLGFLAPIIRRVFEVQDDSGAWSNENIRRLYTRVEKGLIRVDADETTYPLHVILRYEIERGLIEGSVTVEDIPELWAEKMKAYMGIDTTGDYTNGCLQDVHWPASLFGYFPTYTLGAMMAAQFFASAKNAVPGLLGHIGNGEFAPLLAWLRENVHGKGSLLTVDELLTQATGEPLNERFFIDHLKARYG